MVAYYSRVIRNVYRIGGLRGVVSYLRIVWMLRKVKW